MALGIVIKAAFTAKALPLAKDRQRQDLTATERGRRPGMHFGRQRGFTDSVDHDIKCGQEGVDFNYRNCSLSWGR
jgi:hypothetical protein